MSAPIPAVVLEDLAAFTHLVTRLKLAPARRRGRRAHRRGADARQRLRGETVAPDARPRLADAAEGHRGGADRAAPARRRRHGARPHRPRRRPADARRGAADAQATVARARRRRPRRRDRPARTMAAPVLPPPAAHRRRGSHGRGRASGRAPSRRRRLERFEDVVALAGAGARAQAEARAGAFRPRRPLRARPDRDRADRATPLPVLPAICRRSSRNGPAGAGWSRSAARPLAPTIAEVARRARAQLVSDARADPVVAAVLARFPGAEIVDVRVRGEAETARLRRGDEARTDRRRRPPMTMIDWSMAMGDLMGMMKQAQAAAGEDAGHAGRGRRARRRGRAPAAASSRSRQRQERAQVADRSTRRSSSRRRSRSSRT